MHNGAQLPRMRARDRVAHLAHDEIRFRMRRFEQSHRAEAPQTRGGAQTDLRRRGVDMAPVAPFDRPGDAKEDDGEHGVNRLVDAEHLCQRRQQQRAAVEAQREIGRQDEAVAPLPDRFEAGVDHRGARDRQQGEKRARRRHPGEKATDVVEENPADREETERRKRRDRRDALASEPGRAPLAEGAERPLRPPEMERRTRQPHANQRRRRPERHEAESGRRRQAAADRQQRNEGEQAIARPRGGGEDDDRIGRIHRAAPLSARKRAVDPAQQTADMVARRAWRLRLRRLAGARFGAVAKAGICWSAGSPTRARDRSRRARARDGRRSIQGR